MNILQDIKTAVKLTGEVRKARKAGASAVQVKPVYRVPLVNFGYWGFTPESCLFYDPKWKPVQDVFDSLPEEVQHALTFAPKEGEWVERIELWERPLRAALSPELYAEAMAILCEWALRCQQRTLEEVTV